MKLILFDIDGTLLRVTRTGRQLVEDVLSDVIGRRIVTDGIRFSGRTDFPIIRDVMVASGVDDSEIEELLPNVVAAYEERALELLVEGKVDLLPGSADLLRALSERSDVVLGLLTGNIESLAYAKLQACGIVHYFSFGAFGSDRENRYELPPIAVERAFEQTGLRFEGKNVVVIGDTEHDILCGRSIGVFSVAVATGRFDRDYLHRHRPDLLLDDLTRPELLIKAIF
jgi:phosphoglycolate phosphatase-like HAD superfamily hydrolase